MWRVDWIKNQSTKIKCEVELVGRMKPKAKTQGAIKTKIVDEKRNSNSTINKNTRQEAKEAKYFKGWPDKSD